jgi:hypothetical protein
MFDTVSRELVAELDGAVADGSPQRAVQIVRQVTNLLMSSVARLDEPQIGVFDGVLVRLIERIDAGTLIHLSEILSKMELGPRETIRKLAFHWDPLVAAPVLRRSSRLSENDLVEIARTHSQQHLLAISGRNSFSEALTDALVRRGDINVSNMLAENAQACFSECGYATLVGRAERDESLTEKLGLRLDIPANLLRELLAKAADVVRARFLTASRPAMQKRIQGTAATTAKEISAAPRKRTDYTHAQTEVVTLNRAGKLNDSAVNRFAVRQEYTNVVAALSFITEVKIEAIEPLIESDRLYGLMVACKAARLNWSTTKMIIHNRPGCPPATQREFEQGLAVFEGLLLSVAQWTIRFGEDRMLAKRNDRSAMA